MQIGCHISISGGVDLSFERAENLGCETFQIFTQNQRQWKSIRFSNDQIQTFAGNRKKHKYENAELTAHASYLINLCANVPENLIKSRKAFLDELKRCDALNISGLVIHPGAHTGKGEDWGIETIAESINLTLADYEPRVRILLETTAGQGTAIGYEFKQIHRILNKVEKKSQVAVCIDTCHIFAAGYDIRTEQGWLNTLAEIDSTFGRESVKVWHLNDSLKEFASRRDRHAPIGQGFIGKTGFEILMQIESFREIPGILEVPGGDEVFAENIKLLKGMRDLA